MTPAEVLLAERLDDMVPEMGLPFMECSPAGPVRATVDHLLDMAWHALCHDGDEYPDMITADAHLGVAIDLLTTYRQRLKVWDDLDEAEKMLKIGATKDERGDWTMPEGWERKATA